MMGRWQQLPMLGLALLAPVLLGDRALAENRSSLVVVVGAAGAPEYGAQFSAWAKRWQAAGQRASTEFAGLGDGFAAGVSDAQAESTETTDRDRLHQLLIDRAAKEPSVLWLVFIGHGTFDGENAKFNLRGPDISAGELAEWLAPVKGDVVIVNCSSASAPFINRVSGSGRVIVTATKSGDERNFARFGDYISSAISDLRADIDKDGQVSLLEAFLTSSRDAQEYYDQAARLATEHALIDDNSDGAGTPAQAFRGIRAARTTTTSAQLDGTRAHQLHLIASDREARMPQEVRAKRDMLETQIAKLRDEKDNLDESEYYRRLEPLMLELGKLYAGYDSDGAARH